MVERGRLGGRLLAVRPGRGFPRGQRSAGRLARAATRQSRDDAARKPAEAPVGALNLGRYRAGRPSTRTRRLPLLAAAIGAVVLMLALGGSALSFGPTPASTWVVSGGFNGGGVVYSTAVSGSTAYLGGNFTYVGPPTGSFVATDSAGAIASSWPTVGGSVYAAAPDGSGGFFIGGLFSSIGTKHANNIAHINADGTLDTSWSGATDGTVYAIQVSGSSVFAGGAFTQAGGAAHANLAAFGKSSGAVDSTFTAGATGTPSGQTGTAFVASLRLSGSTLYVGGRFASLGAGSVRANIGAVSTSGTVASWAPTTNNVVYALAVGGDGTVYAGGAFTFVNGNPQKYAAAFDPATNAVTGWVPAPNDQVFALEVVGSTVYAGGAFSQIGSTPTSRTGLAALTATGGSASAWNPKVAGQVYAIAAPGDGSTVYVGGSFATVNTNVARDNVVALDATTANATSFSTTVGGSVDAVAVSGGKLGIGGEFRSAGAGGSTAGPVARSNLAAIDLTTGKPTAWNPNANDTVDVLRIVGSTMYAGGAFTAVNGNLTRERLAAFALSSGTATPWNPGVHNGEVDTLAVSGSTVYAGGSFHGTTAVSNPATQRNRVAAFKADGVGNGFGDLLPWNPNASLSNFPNDGAVYALDVVGSTVYLGGNFNRLQTSVVRNFLAAFPSDPSVAGAPTSWNPDPDNSVFALIHVGTTLYAGGAFDTVSGGNTLRGGGAAFDTSGTGALTDWDPIALLAGNVPGLIYSLVASDSTVVRGRDLRLGRGRVDGAPGDDLRLALLREPVDRGRLAPTSASRTSAGIRSQTTTCCRCRSRRRGSSWAAPSRPPASRRPARCSTRTSPPWRTAAASRSCPRSRTKSRT